VSDHTPQTPRERAAIDLEAAAVCLEEIESTLTGDPLAEALEIRGRLEALKGAVERG
jgi:hypothetical protein